MFNNPLRQLANRVSGRRPFRKPRRKCPLLIEPLESRVLLAVEIYTVTTLLDQNDGSAANGLSLREAVQMANNHPGPDQVVLSENVYPLTLAETEGGGPLVVTDQVLFVGDNATIDAGHNYRAFEIRGDAVLEDLTIRNGRSVTEGGAMRIEGVSAFQVDVFLNQVRFENNRTVGTDGGTNLFTGFGTDGGQVLGGAVFVRSANLFIDRGEFVDNVAEGGRGGDGLLADAGDGGFARGGAIYVLDGRLSLDGTILEGNEARGGNGGDTIALDRQGGDGGFAMGGAIYHDLGQLDLRRVELNSNRALGGNGNNDIELFTSLERSARLQSQGRPGSNGWAYGGGVYHGEGAMTVRDSVFSDNGAAGGRLDLGASETSAAFQSGDGAFAGVNGARGGSAFGGALNIGGTDFRPPQGGDFSITGSAFIGNYAFGSNGGQGGGTFLRIDSNGNPTLPREGSDGGHGGDGGVAVGAAVRGIASGRMEISESVFVSNIGIAGRGGAGGFGHAQDQQDGVAGRGGVGGRGGDALGTLFLHDGGQPIIISDSLFAHNKLAAGDGGLGGHAGMGANEDGGQGVGGYGGRGGDGGDVAGGGIAITSSGGESAAAIIENTTITANVIGGGWGANGGLAGDGLIDGGDGGEGGHAGKAVGAGLALLDGASALVSTSTIYANLAVAGDGGHGGHAGDGNLSGGNGGDSGRGGSALGGGLYVASTEGDSESVRLLATTVAENVLEAGASGLPGFGGEAVGDGVDGVPRTHFRAMGGRLRPMGSTAIFLSAPDVDPGMIQPELGNDGNLSVTVTETATISDLDGVEFGVGVLGVGGLGLGTGVIGASVAAFFASSSTTTIAFGGAVAGASIGLVSTAGFLSLGVAGLAVGTGLYLVGVGIGVAIQEGSFEAGMEAISDHLAVTDCDRGVNIAALFGASCDDGDPPELIFEDGLRGARGANGSAQGAGVYYSGFGEIRLGRTIVADNKAISTIPHHPNLTREETLAETQLILQHDGPAVNVFLVPGVETPFAEEFGAELGPGNSDLSTPFYTTTLENRDFDAAGFSQVVSDDFNFVAATDWTVFNKTNDHRGTVAAPLALNSVGRLGLNGSRTPTLKLREDSPARRAGPILIGSPETAQNDYVWQVGQRVDIGAWGGGINAPPEAETSVVFEVLEDQELTLTAANLVGQITDANNDALVVKGTFGALDFSGLPGNTAVTGRTRSVVDTGSNVLFDTSRTTISSIRYTPPANFTGEGQFSYIVSDGEVETQVTATIRVLNVNDAPVLDPIGNFVVAEGSLLSFQANATDVDGDTLTFSLTSGGGIDGIPVGVNLDPQTGEVSWVPPDGVREENFGIRVTDNGSPPMSDTKTVTIFVGNVAPEIDSLTTSASAIGDATAGDEVVLKAAFSDAGIFDTHKATIDWGDGTAETLVDPAASPLEVPHTYAEAGQYTITLTVEDDDGGLDTASTTVLITGAGLHAGELQIIGTAAGESVQVRAEGKGKGSLKIKAPFLKETMTFDSTKVGRIVLMLGDGSDRAIVGKGVTAPVLIDGGEGNDTLDAGDGPTVLVGGAGDDRLSGGRGRNLLIGGVGADRLKAQHGDSLLIAGYTSYDADREALFALLAEWNSKRSYEARIANLRGDTSDPLFSSARHNEDFYLNVAGPDAAVFDDNAVDQLNGHKGRDWFFANRDVGALDILRGLEKDEQNDDPA